ncbi:hypothetical protein HF086_000968 [Spodoptera exigua]|uniref:Uncharacterized protein n=1 Tax=Spodoptera exigua TaxID=7107 RepID=A0A922SHI2_SPOEX|nr:hypothetical protein HF086_000968 [Spodoptera exigua]
MQLIIDSEPALALEKDMSAIEDIGKIGNGNIEQLCEKNCNGNKENIGEGNTNTNDQINKQNNDTDVEPEAQIEIKSFNTELENGNGLKCKETKSNSALNDQETKESQSNNCNGKSESSIVSTEESIKKNQEVIDCESDVSKVNNTDQNNDSAEELTIINNETSTVIEQTISEELASANSIEKTIDNIKAATNNIEMATDNVEVASDTTEGTEAVTNTINVNKSESDTDKTVDTEVPLSSPKDDVEVIEESAESENANKSNENLELPENDKKDDESTMTVDITDAEPIAVILGNEPPIDQDDMDVEVIEETKGNDQNSEKQNKDTPSTPSNIEEQPIVCKLSNTLDILSDDEEEAPKEEPTKAVESSEKQCINIEDDDDIMLIDEDTSKTETPPTVNSSIKENDPDKPDVKIDSETGEKPLEEHDLFAKSESQESKPMEDVKSTNIEIDISEKQQEEKNLKIEPVLPLIPDNFLTSAKKNIADMTREDLEEFCILKIVESIVDRSSLSDIKLKLKSVAQGVEEYRKKITMLTKQNLDLQVVLKSIQEGTEKGKT